MGWAQRLNKRGNKTREGVAAKRPTLAELRKAALARQLAYKAMGRRHGG